MARSAQSFVIIAIGISLLGPLIVPAEIAADRGVQSQPPSLIGDSSSGITFGSLAGDGSGGLWVGGSVFGIQGLLLKSGTRMPRAHRVRGAEYILDLSFTTQRDGWMVADGLLYHTSNGGRSWQIVKTVDSGSDLKSVCFINDQVGWVAGKQGLLIRTTNGGANWQKENTNTDFTIERVRFVNRDKGWAMGKNINPPQTRRILLLTSDGGVTWRNAPGGDNHQFRSVVFVSPKKGWAINSSGEILQSVDGGESWKVQRPADGIIWNSVFFLNELEGWAAGNGVIHSSDGGKTWEYQLKTDGSAEDQLDEIMFGNRMNGTVIGLTRVLVTPNGGRTWKSLSDSWKSTVISRVRREKFPAKKR